MIIFQKADESERRFDVNSVIFRSANDGSRVTNKTIEVLRDFIQTTFTSSEEYNKFILFIQTISSIIRSLMLEYKYFSNVPGNVSHIISIGVKQEEDIFRYIDQGVREFDLKYKIGKYIVDKTNLRLSSQFKSSDKITQEEKKVITSLEINGVILLNHLFTVIFSNIICVLGTDTVKVDDKEFIRLFNRIYIHYFKCGWNFISGLALSNIDHYQETLLFILTEYLTKFDVSKDSSEMLIKGFTDHISIKAA